MPQILGKHISNVVVGRYPNDLYSLLFDQIAHVMESHIDMFGASFLYRIGGNEYATFIISAYLSGLHW